MKRFKLNTGIYQEIYDIEGREEFEELVGGDGRYFYVGSDKIKRGLAVCPACDNPIRILGLYNDVRKIGQHHNNSTAIAKHNEQAYLMCPYASLNRTTCDASSRKAEITDFEREIYCALRDNFDRAVYIIAKDTGIWIGKTLAEKMLRSYLSNLGYAYQWGTLYNIPWVMCYCANSFWLYNQAIRKDSALYDVLSKRKDVSFVSRGENSGKDTNYASLQNAARKFISYRLHFMHHKRKIVSDEVKETIEIRVSTGEPPYEWIFKDTIEINETRFPKLINSKGKEEFRDRTLLDIAKNLMQDI